MSHAGHDHGAPVDCSSVDGVAPAAALTIRVAAIFIIFAASAAGVFLPSLLSRWRPFARGRAAFFVLKAFGAGVILATGLVHMMPAAIEYLTNECTGWPSFESWTGVIMTATMIAVLAAEHAISAAVEARLHRRLRSLAARRGASGDGDGDSAGGRTPLTKRAVGGAGGATSVAASDDVEAGGAPRARRAPHTAACCPPSPLPADGGAACAAGDLSLASVHGVAAAHGHDHRHHHPAAKPAAADACAVAAPPPAAAPLAPAAAAPSPLLLCPAPDDCATLIRHKALAQVLELGIGLHSVLIGVALGVARDAGEVRPLLVAIAFHQCFEGIALGGCLIEAEYSPRATAAMGVAYSLTTSTGIALGIGIRSAYNPNSPTGLGVAGAFDAVAAGILVYMALVDLVAVDFMSARFRADTRLQAAGYGGLVLGALAMSVLAVWA